LTFKQSRANVIFCTLTKKGNGMKKIEQVLAELKKEYAKILPEKIEIANSDDNFAIYLTNDSVATVTFFKDYVLATLSLRKRDDYGDIGQFKKIMEKIIGFPPYCLFFGFIGKEKTFVFIEKNYEKHFNFFKRHQNSFFPGLTKI
jgi:hypothetical protein